MQLANTPPLQSTTPGLQHVSIYQMAPPVRGSKHPVTVYYSVYRPRKDERLSRPEWLVTYRNKVPPPEVEPGHVTHPSTIRARRRVTSLIRPTLLPLRHAATQVRALSIPALNSPVERVFNHDGSCVWPISPGCQIKHFCCWYLWNATVCKLTWCNMVMHLIAH